VAVGATPRSSPDGARERDLLVLVVHPPEDPDMRSILLFLLGVPIPIVILIALFAH
jgi:hypothetical protein